MRTSRVLLAAAITFAASAAAQQRAADRPTIEERLVQLELGFATLETRLARLDSRSQDDPGQSELALAGRITALERAVERLAADLQRTERLADNANRAAGEAQRAAERALRDASLRR